MTFPASQTVTMLEEWVSVGPGRSEYGVRAALMSQPQARAQPARSPPVSRRTGGWVLDDGKLDMYATTERSRDYSKMKEVEVA